MYHEFFGLARAPFNNTPDPAFFFAAEEHEEALATMLFGVEQRRGFVLITGEVGSGKTLLARMLIDRIRSGARVAVIDRPPADERDLLLSVCAKIGVRTRRDATIADLMASLERFLVTKHAEGSLNVIVVDEAQTLSHAALEQFRMLGNLETATSKLLQIVLLGQPELQDLLMDPNLTQLRQRLFCARHVSPLSAEQSAAYIAHRVSVAGGTCEKLFTEGALSAIYEASGGLPRMINHICDNCLLMAFSEENQTVDCTQVEQVVARMMPLQTERASMISTTAAVPPAPARPVPEPAVAFQPVSADSQQVQTSLHNAVAIERNRIEALIRQCATARDDLARTAEAARGAKDALEGSTTAAGGRGEALEELNTAMVSRVDRLRADTETLHQVVQAAEVAIANSRKIADTLTTLRRDALEHEETLTTLNASTARSVELLDDRQDQSQNLIRELSSAVSLSKDELQRLESFLRAAMDARGATGRSIRAAHGVKLEINKKLEEFAGLRATLAAELTDLTDTEACLRGVIAHAKSQGETLESTIETSEQARTELTGEVRQARSDVDATINDAQKATEALIRTNESADKLNTKIQQSAGQATFAAEEALQMVERVTERKQVIDATIESADTMIRRLGETVTDVVELKASLDAQREHFDERSAHLESLVRRIEGAADRVNDIDRVGEETQRVVSGANETMSHLHDSLSIAERRIDNLAELNNRADQCSATVSRSVEEWRAQSAQIEASHEKLLHAVDSMESAVESAAKHSEIAEGVTERLQKKLETAGTIEMEIARRFKAHLATVETCEKKIGDLTQHTDRLDEERRQLAAGLVEAAQQVQAILEDPNRTVAEAKTATSQLRETIHKAGAIAEQLDEGSGLIQRQVKTLKQLKASSDRGFNRLLEQSKASADALRQWVLDAEQAHDDAMGGAPGGEAKTLRSNGGAIKEDETAEPVEVGGYRRPNLLPALDAMLNRPTNELEDVSK